MYNHHACAAKGERTGYERDRRFNARSTQRANINIHKTDNSYEVLVFAPGRIKEHFNIEIKGTELNVSYTPPEGFERPEWVVREYSRGGFTRTINLPDSIDASAISAKYVDGVLGISLPVFT